MYSELHWKLETDLKHTHFWNKTNKQVFDSYILPSFFSFFLFLTIVTMCLFKKPECHDLEIQPKEVGHIYHQHIYTFTEKQSTIFVLQDAPHTTVNLLLLFLPPALPMFYTTYHVDQY